MLIGYNFYPEPTGIGKYSGEMMDWLAEQGHHCTVLTTFPYYPYWKVQEPYRKKRFWYKKEKQRFDSGGSITVIRCPIYVPANPTGVRRMVLDFSFLLSSFLALPRVVFQKKYDLTVAVAPSFLIAWPAVVYKALRGGRFLYHIQDMQIEAARDLGMIKSKFLLNLLFNTENLLARRADQISSISDGMINKLSRKFHRDIYFFPNWADISRFYRVDDPARVKTEFGFDPDDIIFLYSGGIGQKQGLEAIIHAADTFGDNPKVKFVICGSGPYKAVLENMAQNRTLGNVHFFPLQPIEKFNDFLNIADAHLVIQKADASDLMLPSKLTTILAVGGLPIITANPGSGLYSLVENHSVGVIVDAENQDQLNQAISNVINRAIDAEAIRVRARSYAESFLDVNEIMQRFERDQKLKKDKSAN